MIAGERPAAGIVVDCRGQAIVSRQGQLAYLATTI